MPRSKLVVIGWHGGNWKTLHPLIDAGLMPHFSALVERGVAGNLASFGPGIPALLWTTIATGKSGEEHGILTAMEPDPLSGSVRESSSVTRRTKAIWNIVMQAGRVVHTAGWPATHPAEPLNGSCITPRFAVPSTRFGQPWPVPENSLHPARLESELAEMRVHPGELSGADMVQFIPKLAEIDQERDGRVIALADMLSRSISIHSAVTWLMENEPWDAIFLGWESLERASQTFIRYAPPGLDDTTEEDCERYGEVVTGMHCFHDMMLGRILRLAGPDATIAIVSPTAFRNIDDAPPPSMRALPGAWYRPHGIFCMAGPNIVDDELIHGASILDVAPTLLAAMNIKPGLDMPGRVLEQIFREKPAMDRIPSWDDVPGDCGMHPVENEVDREIAQAALRALAGAGYKEPEETEWAARVRRERLLNTALLHLSGQRFAEARRILVQLSEEISMDRVEATRIALWLAQCHLLCGDPAACRATAATLPAEGLGAIFAGLLKAHIEVTEHRVGPALEALESTERFGKQYPIVNYATAIIHFRLRNLDKAEHYMRRAIELDPAFQPAKNALAGLLAARGKGEQAAEVALSSLEIDYASALGHLALGLAMAGSAETDEALKAFERSTVFDPDLAQSRAWARALRSNKSKVST